MISQEIQKSLLGSFEIDEQLLPAVPNEDEKFKAFRALLIRRIEVLVESDLQKLYSILYRIDVNERKMKNALEAGQQENSAPIIADLIIERQLEKIKSRKHFGEKENDWNFDV